MERRQISEMQMMSECYGVMNSNLEFGQRPYEKQETIKITHALQQKLTNEEVSIRPGPGGKKLTYVEHGKVVDIANEIFGFDGWSCITDSLNIDYCEKDQGNTWSVGCHAIVRVILPNGCYHTDIGWGQADRMRNRGDAQEKAMKQAVSDGRKRALRIFGQRLGNSIYDKDHLEYLKDTKTKKQKIEGVNSGACAPGFVRSSYQTEQISLRHKSTVREVSNNSKTIQQEQLYGMKVITRDGTTNQQSSNCQEQSVQASSKSTISHKEYGNPVQHSHNGMKMRAPESTREPKRNSCRTPGIADEKACTREGAQGYTNKSSCKYDDEINDEALAAISLPP